MKGKLSLYLTICIVLNTYCAVAADRVVVIPLMGKGTAIGNAIPEDVLAGKTFSSSSGAEQTGSMTDKGATVISPGASTQKIPEGYHNGEGTVTGDSDLNSSNIRSGVSIFGVVGTSIEASGSATPAQVLSGHSFSNASGAATGTMPFQELDDTTTELQSGYYSGTDLTTVDTDLDSSNIKSGTTIFGISGNSNVVDTSSGDAVAGDIRSGKKAWVDGSEVAGSLASQSLSAGSKIVSAGYYSATTLDGVDGDLASGNIKDGTTIFGVTGTFTEEASNPIAASDVRQGQVGYVNGTQVVGTSTFIPTCSGTLNGTRWCDNGDGTVTDMTTGLVWLKNANCSGISTLFKWADAGYNDAHTYVGLVYDEGTNDCGLTDSSTEGEWRLPTSDELYGIFNGTEFIGNKSARAFANIRTGVYWTSSTATVDTTKAWGIASHNGTRGIYLKSQTGYVWPVRGGQ